MTNLLLQHRVVLKTLLVAEDDTVVQLLLKDMLERYGYTVILACDGASAIKTLEKNKDRIDLALLDIVMPERNGYEAFEAMKMLKPDLKAIFMSGYVQDIIGKDAFPPGDLLFVEKTDRNQHAHGHDQKSPRQEKHPLTRNVFYHSRSTALEFYHKVHLDGTQNRHSDYPCAHLLRSLHGVLSDKNGRDEGLNLPKSAGQPTKAAPFSAHHASSSFSHVSQLRQ